MASLKIDELNTLNDFSANEKSVNENSGFDYQDFIKHYFDPMQITKTQRKKRQELAQELMDFFLYVLIWCEKAPERVQTEEIQRKLQNEFKEKAFGYSEPDAFFDTYVPMLILQIIQTTLNHPDDDYYTSVERAAVIGCNEANTVMGNTELVRAKTLGKKWKIWRTELDDRVRPTHQEMEGVTVPINKPFTVNESLMMFPKDSTLGADPMEIVNCRCVCEYK